MDSVTRDSLLLSEKKPTAQSINSIKLDCDQTCSVAKCIKMEPNNPVQIAVQPSDVNLDSKKPISHEKPKFSFAWKKTLGKLNNAKVNTTKENIVIKSFAKLMKQVPNIATQTSSKSVSNEQSNQNCQDLTEVVQNEKCENQRKNNVQTNPETKTGAQDHNIDSTISDLSKTSYELQTGDGFVDTFSELHPSRGIFTRDAKTLETDQVQTTNVQPLGESPQEAASIQQVCATPSLSQVHISDESPLRKEVAESSTLPTPIVENNLLIPPPSYAYLPSQELHSMSNLTPHPYYPLPVHHPFLPPSENVSEYPDIAFQAFLDRKTKYPDAVLEATAFLESNKEKYADADIDSFLAKKKKESQLKERRVEPEPLPPGVEPYKERRRSRSPGRLSPRVELHKERRRSRSRSPGRRKRHKEHHRRDYSPRRKMTRHSNKRHRSTTRHQSTEKSNSRSPDSPPSKKLDSRSRSPLSKKLSRSRSPPSKKSDTSSTSPLSKKSDSRSRSTTSKKSVTKSAKSSPKKYTLEIRTNSDRSRKKSLRKEKDKSMTPSPADISKLDDPQSEDLINSKIKTLSIGSIKSLKTKLKKEKSKMDDRMSSIMARKKKSSKRKRLPKSKTLPPTDYSKLDDTQSEGLIQSKLKNLSLTSLTSLRTSLLNELLDENLSVESELESSPCRISENMLKENDTLEPSESFSDQQPSVTGEVAQPIRRESLVNESYGESEESSLSTEAQEKQFSADDDLYFSSSMIPVDSHLREFLIEEKFIKGALPILRLEQPFGASTSVLKENNMSQSGEPSLHHQPDKVLQPNVSSHLPDKSSDISCPEVLDENNSFELPEENMNENTVFSLRPFLSLEWQIKRTWNISPSDQLDDGNASHLTTSCQSLSPVVKLDWKLEPREIISSGLLQENNPSELKEPGSKDKTDATFSAVPSPDMVCTSNLSEQRNPKTTEPSPIEPIESPPTKSKVTVDNTLGILSSLPPGISGVSGGSLINPNILNCGLCGKTCKRSVVLPCCLAQACNGCAVSAITKNRICWGCSKPVMNTKELNQDKVLREAIDWFRANGTIKKDHGESLIVRRQLIIDRKAKLSKAKEKSVKSRLGKRNGIADRQDSRISHPRTLPRPKRSNTRNRKRSKTDSGSYKSPGESRSGKRDRNSRKQPRIDDNSINRSMSQRGKEARPKESKSLSKLVKERIQAKIKTGEVEKPHDRTSESIADQDVSVITRVKRKILEKIERLQTDQERLSLAKSAFENPICADPTINMTFHGYKRRKLLVMQDENQDSFYDFYSNPKSFESGQVKSEDRQKFYLKAGDTVAMPGFKKIFKMDIVEVNATKEGESNEKVSAQEFKLLLENEFKKNNNPLKKSGSKKENFKKRFSHFQAVHSEAINFLQFYKSELESRQVQEIVYLENLYKTCSLCYGKTEPIFCKSCNVSHKF